MQNGLAVIDRGADLPAERAVRCMDNFSQYQQHIRKLFSSTAALALPDHRLLEMHTLDIGADSVKIVAAENLPDHLDCLIHLVVPVTPAGFHAVIAHARTLGSVFDGKLSGFLMELRFTDIPAQSLRVIHAFLKP
jgi:hypothetical protein